MCGISGFNFENKPLLKKMCDLIIHRDPNDVGYNIDSGVSIGIRRLSIRDLGLKYQLIHKKDWITQLRKRY